MKTYNNYKGKYDWELKVTGRLLIITLIIAFSISGHKLYSDYQEYKTYQKNFKGV